MPAKQGPDFALPSTASLSTSSPSTISTLYKGYNSREGPIGRLGPSLTSTDELNDTAVFDEDTHSISTHDQHYSRLNRITSTGEDLSSLRGTRRPSSSSIHSSVGSSGKSRRRSNPSIHTSVSPRPRSASRSKILASSALSLEKSSISAIPLPYEHRIRAGSGDRNNMADASTGGLITHTQSPKTTNTRLDASPKPTNRYNVNHSNTSNVVMSQETIADRKRRLAAAAPASPSSSSLGIIKSQQPGIAEVNPNRTPQKSTFTRASLPSLKSSPENQVTPSKGEIKGTPNKAVEDEKKPSLRSRLFGLRRTPPKGTAEEAIDTSDANPITSSLTNVSTNQSKKANHSTQRAEDAVSMVRTTSKTSSRKGVPTLNIDLLSPDSASAVRPMNSRIQSKGSIASGLTNSSWITSLSNVSPPSMPEYATLRASPISMSRGDSNEASPTSPDSRLPLFRTTSWPAGADRRGSFVSVKGGTSGGGKGYRFENAAASQTRISPTPSATPTTARFLLDSPNSLQEPIQNALQFTNEPAKRRSNTTPAFLSIDPSPNLESPPPAERREKSRVMISKLGSPSALDMELPPDTGRRLRAAHERSGSLSSNPSMQSSRSSHSRQRVSENAARKGQWRNSSAIPMSWQDGHIEPMLDKRQKRSSTTAIGLLGTQSSASLTSSALDSSSVHSSSSTLSFQITPAPIAKAIEMKPSFTTSQIQPPINRMKSASPPSPVMPRTSSLHGRNSTNMLSRTSSNTNASFRSAGSPIEVMDEYMQDKAASNSVKRKTLLPGIGSAAIAGGASVAAILAKVTELGDGEKEEEGESKGSIADLSSVDTISESMSRDSELDRTLLAENAPRPPPQQQQKRMSQQGTPTEEPKRPTKSPLRKISATTIHSIASSQSRTALSSPVRSKAGSMRILPASPAHKHFSERNDELNARMLGSSPPRHSLEDLAQLRALADHHFAADSPSSSHKPLASEDIILQNVPQSAKRLADVTTTHESKPHSATENTIQSTASTLTVSSATKEKEEHEIPVRRNIALERQTPPSLANAFNEKVLPSTVSRVSSSNLDLGAEDEGERAPSIKKKVKKWPFQSKESHNEANDVEKRVPSMGSKVANSLRGRKSEPQSSRLQIRRLYDGPRQDEIQDDTMRMVSGETTLMHSPTFAVTPRNEMRESSGHSFLSSIDSGPTTPTLAQEEMLPEIKKLVHRRNVIRELVETEKSYSSDLVVVRDIYLARAKTVVGLSAASSLQTPLSAFGTPTGTPTTSLSNISKSSPLVGTHRNVQRMASYEMKIPPSSPGGQQLVATASPSSTATSSEPSNRSSTYTVSSQTSQASDSSFPFNASSAPPLPATPPNLANLSSFTSSNTLQAPSPSSINSGSTLSVARNLTGKPKVQVSTTSLPLQNAILGQTTPSDVGFTVTDLRVMFGHLEACCTFAEDMSSVLAGCMGTFARSKRLDSADVTMDMDKEDDRIGETFLQLMPRIRKIYVEYCSRHEAGMSRLQEVLASSSKANDIFKESTELARKHTNAWDLASLLIKPVQRVLKYPLLIQQILNSTAKTHPDYDQLSLAFNEIQAVADQINQVKKRKDLAETLIIGKSKEAKAVMSSTSTLKGRKKPEYHSEDGLLTPFGGEEIALDEYVVLLKQFESLVDYVARFTTQCTTWTRSLRESHESQINVMRSIRRTYRLHVEEVGADGVTRTKENKESFKLEEKLVARYIKLLQTLLAESCRKVDRSVRLNLVPLIGKLADSFEAPRSVMIKRDERQADYQRYRQIMLTGRQLDRKLLENANGFIALNAQLVEELPLFLQGVRTLLDICVHAFAQLQAGHFYEVRNQTLTFWNTIAKKSDEIVIDENSGQLSMRPINPVRVFWNRHSQSATSMESIGILRRDVGMIVEDGGDMSSSSSTSALTSNAKVISALHVVDRSEANFEASSTLPSKIGTPTMEGVSNGNDNNSFQNGNAARRPKIVGNLMRSLSGTFAKDQDGEVIPPLPSNVNFRQLSETSSSKTTSVPMLPNLAFKDKDGESGYFVQSGPIPFLDANARERSNQSYHSSTPMNEITMSRKSFDGASLRDSTHTRSDSNLTSISIQANEARQALPGEQIGDAPRRQRMNVLYVCVAIADSRSELLHCNHLGWPFITFIKGDTLRVLSSSDSTSTPLLFGRIDRSGEIGWAEKRYF